MESLALKLNAHTSYAVSARSVATITASPLSEEAGLELIVGEGAGVHLVLPEVPRRGNIVVEVGARAQFTFSIAALCKGAHEFQSQVKLVGDGARAHVQVAYVGISESDVNLLLTLSHIARSTFGRMVVRRVQYSSSFSTLKGMLKVAPEAHATDTYLSDKVLLIGDKARAESNPGLEILADDVRASHGATVGQLSPDELFYVRSRGLTEALAQELLVQAFLSSAMVGLPPEYNLKLYAAK